MKKYRVRLDMVKIFDICTIISANYELLSISFRFMKLFLARSVALI
jgi:hypothetical protein